jgi:hypothetical protein
VFTDPTDEADAATALATCARCHVREACLDTALAHEALGDTGIWGGTTHATREQIRTGDLTRDDATHLDLGRHLTRPADGQDEPCGPVAVFRDVHGDYLDDSGRVLITPLPHGGYMAFLDRRPIASTPTLLDACTAAANDNLNAPDRHPDDRPAPPLLEVTLDDHGHYHDPSRRILITRPPGRDRYLVFVDDRFHQQTATLDQARATANRALHHPPPDLRATPTGTAARTDLPRTRAHSG